MKLWNNFLEKLKRNFGSETVEKWLRPLEVLKFDAGNLFLNATDSFQISWFREHVRDDLKNENGRTILIHFYLNGKPFAQRAQKGSKKALAKQYFSSDSLSSHATFENFVKDTSPFIAIELLKAADSTYNPIFIYGPAGSGKTHLLMATAQKLRQAKQHAFYVHTHTFAGHVVRAFKANSLHEFRCAYRNTDCLIIDDVHYLKHKTVTQEELFHTFNHLHTRGKQLIISANTAPARLQGVEERLKSRFDWGMALPLSIATLDEKKQILKKKIMLLSIPLTELMQAHLQQMFHTLPTLVRALETLQLRWHQSHLELTLPTINYLLRDLIREEISSSLTPKKIVETIAEVFQIDGRDILGKSQHRECVLPRKFGMYFCRHTLNMPYTKIGEFFSRDHSTVISSVKQIERGRKSKKKSIALPVIEIQERLAKKSSP